MIYLPWLPNLRAQMRLVHGVFWMPKPRARDLLETLCIVSGIDTRTLQDLFRRYFYSRTPVRFLDWAPAFLLAFFLCVIGTLYSVRPVDRRKSAALLTYSVVPVLLVFLDRRLFTPVYVNRAFIGCCVLLPQSKSSEQRSGVERSGSDERSWKRRSCREPRCREWREWRDETTSTRTRCSTRANDRPVEAAKVLSFSLRQPHNGCEFFPVKTQ